MRFPLSKEVIEMVELDDIILPPVVEEETSEDVVYVLAVKRDLNNDNENIQNPKEYWDPVVSETFSIYMDADFLKMQSDCNYVIQMATTMGREVKIITVESYVGKAFEEALNSAVLKINEAIDKLEVEKGKTFSQMERTATIIDIMTDARCGIEMRKC